MKKSKITPDPLRDPPKNQGEYQAPGPHLIIPGRAYGDNRFNQFPMTLRAFSICCAHANSWTGIFFPNQKYIAQVLQCSQQAVSQHMQRLLQWEYIEKLRNADIRRKYGKKGALWRIRYDITKTLDDAIAMQPAQDRDPELEAEIARHNLGITGPKGQKNKAHIVQDAASIKEGIETNNKPGIVPGNKAQLVNNSTNLTNINTKGNIKEYDCRNLCNIYSQILLEHYGKPFSYDLRQIELARDLLSLGYTAETFKADAAGVIKWKRNKNQQPPYSLQYFLKRKQSQGMAQGQASSMDIVKHLANRMKLK